MPDLDTILTAYANPLRRAAVQHLYNTGSAASLETLTERVTRTLPDVQNRREIKMSMQHQHLPQLEKSNLITWDTDTDAIELDDFDENAKRLIQELETLEKQQ